MNNPIYFRRDRMPEHDEADTTTADKIRSFSHLPAGWHYGEGRGATSIAVESVLAIQTMLMAYNANEIEVFPDINGGILLSVYHEEETLEIFCDHDGKISMLHEAGDDVLHEKNDVSSQEIYEYMEDLRWDQMKPRIMRSSDCFIRSTSAVRRDDLRVWHSRTPQKTVVSRSSIPGAPEGVVERNANIYALSTPGFQVSRRCSGESAQLNYQTGADWNTSRPPPEMSAT